MSPKKAFHYLFLESEGRFLVLSVLFFGLAIFLTFSFKSEKKRTRLLERFQRELIEKEDRTDKLLDELGQKVLPVFVAGNFHTRSMNRIYEKEGLAFFIFTHDTLLYWTTNAVPVPAVSGRAANGRKMIHTGNGFFEVRQKRSGPYLILGLIRIKSDYRYQNKHLANDFAPGFRLPPGTEPDLSKSQYNVYTSDKDFLFSLQIAKARELDDTRIFLLFLLYLLGFLFFISFLVTVYRRLPFLKGRRGMFFPVFAVNLLILRLIIFYFRIPHVLYDSALFGPAHFASSALLPSLGDFFINALLLLVAAYQFYLTVDAFTPRFGKRKVLPLVPVLALYLFVFLFHGSVVSLIRKLIVDSAIPLDLGNLFSLNVYSAAGLFIITFLLMAYFLAACSLVKAALKCNPRTAVQLLMLLIAGVVFYAACRAANIQEITHYAFAALLVIFLLVFSREHKPGLSASEIFFWLIAFSLFASVILQRFSVIKEKESRKVLAVKLTRERDPVAEFVFRDIERKIFRDSSLLAMLPAAVSNEKTEARAAEYIEKTYFRGYWSRFDLQITLCSSNKRLNIKPNNLVINCRDYFRGILKSVGEPTMNEDLFYLNNGSGYTSYLAVFGFLPQGQELVPGITAFVEINSKFIPEGLGYPELLNDKEMEATPDLSGYSYAIYKNGGLFRRFGKFNYELGFSAFSKSAKTGEFFDLQGYNHLIYRQDPSTLLVISTQNPSFLEVVSPFSYLIIFLGIFLLFFLLIVRMPVRLSQAAVSFSGRLQAGMTGIVLVSFLLIGASTLYYLVKLNNRKNEDILREKAHSVLIELEDRFTDRPAITASMGDTLAGLLTRNSSVFFTDINLYDTLGNLLASSRPQIFEENLISTKMNASAYQVLSVRKKSFLIQSERIGKYDYLSVYLPFLNDQNQMTAYLNLPYFARQSELRNEVSTFLVALINIYVLLIVLSVGLALALARRITRPLQLIRDKLGNLSLGRPNEKIEWKRKDEIASLVNEYNRMLDELGRSAEILAASERENAWREMAKQVAHEIKNPLTPMKLSVQYLQKAWDEQAPGWEERLKRFTQTLVEQIDSLSLIATEFSSFAKMPEGQKTRTDLAEIIRNTIELFRDHDNIRIVFDEEGGGKYFLDADKGQLIRIFNNLIQNSVQAIGGKAEGRIEIKLRTADGFHLVNVSDNGLGISVNQQPRIFVPNFTTKSGGTGLGLAMVKSMVENMDGTIWFESAEGKGTTFFISLPAGKA